MHSGEIEYALGNLEGNAVYAWTARDRRVSQVMQDYFVQFARRGDPNAADLPAWPAVRAARGGLLRQTIAGHTRSDVDRGATRQAFLQAFMRDHPGTR